MNPAIQLTSAAGLVALMASLSVLHSCDKPVQKITLNPAEIGTVHWLKENEAEWSCFPGQCIWLEPWGAKCPINVNQNAKIQVGYNYHHDAGTRPCNCWWYRDCIFRGGVRFDIGALQGKKVVGAQLKWAERGACATRLFTAGAPWSEHSLAPSEQLSNPWPANSQGPGQVEVGQDVRDWLDGKKVNRGWLFVGADETFPNYLWVEGSAEISPANIGTHKCTSPVSGFKLEVQFTD
jgi:hypothetical protein